MKHNGKFLIFKDQLEPIKSLTLVQSKQLIDIIKYLYDCNIIHRDLRPHNLMLDNSRQHLKLIDSGFAIRFNNQEKSQELSIAFTTTFVGYEFLKFYSNLSLNSLFVRHYPYERTFDLKCALNIIMYMNYNDIRNKLHSIETLRFFHEKASASLQLWKDIKQKDENYSNFLNVITNLTESSALDALKDQVENFYIPKQLYV